MRILHLVSYSLFSGPLPPTLGVALAQREAGHEVWLAYDTKRGAFNPFEEAAAPVVEPHRLQPLKSLTLSAKSSLGELWRDRTALRQLWPTVDVVHAHLSHDHTLAAMTRSKRAPGLMVRTFHSARALRGRMGQEYLNRRTDGFVVRARSHGALLEDTYNIPHDCIAFIPGGIDAQYFQPVFSQQRRHMRERLELPMDALVLGQVALITDRGQWELLNAFDNLGGIVVERNLHLLFVGRGENEQALQQRAAKSPFADRVHFSGYLQGIDLVQGYGAMDAAFCAQTGNDASARASLEAMAMGLPVLAVQEDALGELVSETTGYPIPHRSPDEIRNGISTWLSDLRVGQQRGAAGREFVLRERSFASEAEKLLEFYERLGSS